jgi:hypothetical protein
VKKEIHGWYRTNYFDKTTTLTNVKNYLLY